MSRVGAKAGAPRGCVNMLRPVWNCHMALSPHAGCKCWPAWAYSWTLFAFGMVGKRLFCTARWLMPVANVGLRG
eukprot:2833282-Alexandrium_andersonii.AAC.1